MMKVLLIYLYTTVVNFLYIFESDSSMVRDWMSMSMKKKGEMMLKINVSGLSKINTRYVATTVSVIPSTDMNISHTIRYLLSCRISSF